MGRAPCCDKANVKKGPWSPEEDTKLKEFIEKYGTGGNWIALPHKAGLKRCGKSCRLRWLNYLRPNLKHGEFSETEDRIICSLFATIGSRWSIIAAQLPGRTDNDIKNYWNTKLKKKLLGISPSQRIKPNQNHHHHQHQQQQQQQQQPQEMMINNQNSLLFSSLLPSLPPLVPPHLLTTSSSPHGFDFCTHTHNNNNINVLHPPFLNQYQISFGGGGDQQNSCTSSDISYNNNNNNQGFLYGGLEEMSTHDDDQDIKAAHENLVASYGEAPPPPPPLEYSYEEEMKNLMSPLDYSSYVDDNEGGFKNQERGVMYHF